MVSDLEMNTYILKKIQNIQLELLLFFKSSTANTLKSSPRGVGSSSPQVTEWSASQLPDSIISQWMCSRVKPESQNWVEV